MVFDDADHIATGSAMDRTPGTDGRGLSVLTCRHHLRMVLSGVKSCHYKDVHQVHSRGDTTALPSRDVRVGRHLLIFGPIGVQCPEEVKGRWSSLCGGVGSFVLASDWETGGSTLGRKKIQIEIKTTPWVVLCVLQRTATYLASFVG